MAALFQVQDVVACIRERGTAMKFIPYCTTSDAATIPHQNGTCSFCDSPLPAMPASPPVHPDLQRVLEATTLLHLTEPRTP